MQVLGIELGLRGKAARALTMCAHLTTFQRSFPREAKAKHYIAVSLYIKVWDHTKNV